MRKDHDSIVANNIIGLQNVIDASRWAKVKKFIFTSSDKAVNPTNVMGTSKLMGERMVTAANSRKKSKGTIFASTRFGNVIGSRGSVFPLFQNQIKNGGPVTITDLKMTRFVMTIEESVELILESALIARGGEVFVTKMPVVGIRDLAEVMIEELAPKYGYQSESIKMQIIGSKPGEKMYEELLSDEEVNRAYESKRFFSILPAFRAVYENIDYSYTKKCKKATKAYVSKLDNRISKEEIKAYLMRNKLL